MKYLNTSMKRTAQATCKQQTNGYFMNHCPGAKEHWKVSACVIITISPLVNTNYLEKNKTRREKYFCD